MTDMLTVSVDLGHASYPVYIGAGILGSAPLWEQHLGRGKVLIVSNAIVAPLYLDQLRTALGDRDVVAHIIPDGEPHKTLQTWSGILDRLIASGARRDVTVIALGGGVVGDITGFAAASYMRGVRFIQAPTTLLAQVDASVGGKTGINHQQGKNLIGAFHQPAAVIVDTATLATLEAREFNAGMAEVVKYGAIMDSDLLDYLERSVDAINQRQPEALDHLIHRSILNKAQIVAADELEGGIRAILNFGHSFGHAVEAITAYSRYLHGEAVAIGMIIAAHLSEQRGLCAEGAADRLDRLLQQFSLPTRLPESVGTDEIVQALQLDKKAVAGALRLILLNRPGRAIINDSSSGEEIVRAIDSSRLAL